MTKNRSESTGMTEKLIFSRGELKEIDSLKIMAFLLKNHQVKESEFISKEIEEKWESKSDESEDSEESKECNSSTPNLC
jgi:hypothetical protein